MVDMIFTCMLNPDIFLYFVVLLMYTRMVIDSENMGYINITTKPFWKVKRPKDF